MIRKIITVVVGIVFWNAQGGWAGIPVFDAHLFCKSVSSVPKREVELFLNQVAGHPQFGFDYKGIVIIKTPAGLNQFYVDWPFTQKKPLTGYLSEDDRNGSDLRGSSISIVNVRQASSEDGVWRYQVTETPRPCAMRCDEPVVYEIDCKY